MLNNFNIPFGFEVIVNNLIQPYWTSKQVKFPKSKKSRIRKKWRKNKANWKSEYHNEFIVMGNRIFMNQTNYDLLLQNWQPETIHYSNKRQTTTTLY